MKTYFSDIIPRITRFSKKIDTLTKLKNQKWVLINELNTTKKVFIFRDNNQLLISKNGKVKRENWEFLGENNLLIDIDGQSYLFQHGFLDENIFALKMDSNNNYAFLINESKYGSEINSVADINKFLINKYLGKKKQLPHTNYIKAIINIERGFFGNHLEIYKVHFNDRLDGEIYVRKNSQRAFFIDGINYTSKMKRYYINPDFCILALHEFLKTGIILKEGLVESLIF